MSNIEWTDATWNPVRGCRRVSKGCENCYAERQAHRFSAPGQPYHRLTRIGPKGPQWTGAVRTVPEMLDAPLRWRKPRRVFVNSMSDLYHEDVPDEFIETVFGVMAVAGAKESVDRMSAQAAHGGCFHGAADGHDNIGTPQPLHPGGRPVQMRMPRYRSGPHTFQVLTKRPLRMAALLSSAAFREAVSRVAYRWAHNRRDAGHLADCIAARNNPAAPGRAGRLWPLPNVWLGTSIEDRASLHRLDALRDVPAAVRFLSLEPLLEDLGTLDLRGIHWVIIGGESGPGARPCDVEWIRSAVRQCRDAGVRCFVKQLGARPVHKPPSIILGPSVPLYLRHKKGADPSEWPEWARVREWPEVRR